MHNSVLVVGTGSIGQPLTGLLATLSKELAVDEIMFYKHTPRKTDLPLVEGMHRKGAILCCNKENFSKWREMGIDATYTFEEALDRAKIVADCSTEGKGLENKTKFYEARKNKIQNFLAQGSEKGFGTPFIAGINDYVLNDIEKNQFLQIMSCNTHNICLILKDLAFGKEGPKDILSNPSELQKLELQEAKFVCMRRASDISQDDSYIASPEVGTHKDPRFGSHHAQDAHRLFKTMGYDLNLFSTAVKIPTQFMHVLFFDIKLKDTIKVTREEIIEKFRKDPYVALTYKNQSALVFSFGREYGYYGRLLDQSVLVEPSVAVRTESKEKTQGNEIVGYCFTPQDGNSLLSSTTAITSWLVKDKEEVQTRLKCLDKYRFNEV